MSKQIYGSIAAFVVGILSGLGGIFWWINANPTDQSPTQMAYLETEIADSLMVCSLTDEELFERKEALRQELLPLVTSTNEHPYGYRFEFRSQAGLAEKILGFIEAERSCCPFFHFDLAFHAFQGKLVLTISGPPGTKSFIDFLAE